MEYLVSIVVPIFNVEKYLEQCLSSIYALRPERVQIILVDDGSTDSSNSIIKKFAKKHPDNTVVIEQVHSSVSAARNAGIRKATGKWLAFVDSDDFIDSKNMDSIYDYLEVCRTDIVTFDGFRYIEENGNTLPLNNAANPFDPKTPIASFDYLVRLIDNNMTNVVTIWDKIYKLDSLKSAGIQFIEEILHEDVAYIFDTFLSGLNVEVLDVKAIFYRQRPGSIMYTPSPHKIFSKIKVIEHLLHLFNKHNISNTVLNDYLVFSCKGLIIEGHKVPVDLLSKISSRKLSLKKRIQMIMLKYKNAKLST